MFKTTIRIDGMMCSMCEAHVNDAIRKRLDVKKVRSSRKKGETIVISEKEFDKDMIEFALEDSGYKVLDVKSEPFQKRGLFHR
ncbi:MAG: heavy-metal-associated domain-containing protein [Ruminococcus sp.]|nr:heavy-metal-associated domain-containing protein [Ruminococcus sp.]